MTLEPLCVSIKAINKQIAINRCFNFLPREEKLNVLIIEKADVAKYVARAFKLCSTTV